MLIIAIKIIAAIVYIISGACSWKIQTKSFDDSSIIGHSKYKIIPLKPDSKALS